MKRILSLLGVLSFWMCAQGQIVAPFTESFDSLTIPTNWANTSVNTLNGANWFFTGTPGNPSMATDPRYVPAVVLDHTANGGGIAWSDGSNPAVADCGLLTDSIDVSSLTSLFLQFYYYSNNVFDPSLGNNVLSVHFYDGAQWNNNVFTYSGSNGLWQYAGIDLSSYTITGNILFEFVVDQTTMTNAFYNDILLDDISVINVPPCPIPSAFQVLDLDSSMVTFSYENSNDSVNYFYGPKGFNQASSSVVLGSANDMDTITFTNLIPDTEYDVYLISNCNLSGNGLSDTAGPFNFTTHCGYQKIKFTDNFDQSNTLGNCFSTFFSAAGPGVSVVNFQNPFSAPNHILFTNGALPSTDDALLIGPAIWRLSDLDKQVKFSAFTNSGGVVEVEVGTIASLDNPGAFNLVQSFTLGNSYQEFIAEFNAASNYNGTDAYVVFRHKNNSSFQNIYMDNLEIDSIPSCRPTSIFDFGGSSAGTDVALYWTPGDGATWDITYGAKGFNLIGGTTVNSIDTVETISSLLPNTVYDFYLRDNCGTSNSPYIGPISFLTGCASITTVSTLPFFDGFEFNSGTIIGDSNLCNTSYSFEFRDNTGQGQLRFNAGAAFYKTGAAAATLDRLTFGTENTNFMTYTFDLTNYTTSAGIMLSFSFAHHGQESHAEDRVWARGSSSDPWIEIYDLNLNQNSSGGVFVDASNLNIVSFLANASQTVSSSTQIRFGQVGTSTAFSPTFSDGYTFDDISLVEVQCPSPSGLGISNLADTAATLTWLPNSAATGYGVWFGPQGFFQGSNTQAGLGVQFNTNSPGFLIDTLTPNRCYEYGLRVYCTNLDTSIWVGPFQFCTPCAAFSATYFENWDAMSANQDPECWGAILEGPNSQFADVDVVGFSARSFPNCLEIYNQFGSNTIIAASPFVPDLTANNKRITFYARSFSAGATIVVGTLPSSGSSLGFSALDTFAITQTNNYEKFVFEFTAANGYNGTDQFFALAHGQAGTFQTINVDDVTYEIIPSCPEVSLISVFSVDSNSAQVGWDIGSVSAPNYEIEYGTGIFGSATNTRVIVTNDTASLNSLTEGTNYCVWVRKLCSATDSSVWDGPVCFKTRCKAISAPYQENWNTLTFGNDLGCFGSIEDPGLASSTFTGITIQTGTFGSPISPPAYVEMDNSSFNSSPLILVSPATRDMRPGDKRVAFYARNSSTFSTGDIFAGTISDPGDASTFHPLDTFSISGNVPMVEYFMDINPTNGYNGTDEYFALAHGQNSTFITLFVDDVNYTIAVSNDVDLTGAALEKTGFCLGTNDTLSIDVFNKFGGVIDFSVDTLKATYTLTGPVNSAGTGFLGTGTLASSASTKLFFTGVDLSQPGTYTLDAYIDPNNKNLDNSNDTLGVSVSFVVRDPFAVTQTTNLIINNVDTACIEARSPFFGGNSFIFTEMRQFASTGSGTVPSYLASDDYIEITGVPGSDLDGINLQVYDGTLRVDHIFPSGTIIGPNGTCIIMHGQGAGVSQPLNYMYDGRGTSTWTYSSGSVTGYILRDGNTIIDAVGCNGFVFPATSGVTASDWSGVVPGSGGTAGIRLIGVDNNLSSDWNVASAAAPQDAQVLNANVPLPIAGSVSGFSWSLNGVPVDTMPKVVVGPFATSGVYNYVATYNSPCGVLVDTATITVIIPTCPSPFAISATPGGPSSINLAWDTTGTGIGGASYEIDYGSIGHVAGGGTIMTAPSSISTIIAGIPSNVCQDIYLRSVCSATDTGVWIGPIQGCPSVSTCDSINDYAFGLIEGQSALFLPWQATAGAMGTASITAAQSAGGGQSLRMSNLTGNATDHDDVIAYFDTISSGAWRINWDMYIPSTRGGYYNIQQNHALNGIGNQWNAEIYFQGNGTGQIQHSAAATVIGTFNYTQAQWFEMSTVVDLTNDTIWFEINGTSIGLGFDYSVVNAGSPQQFNGVNFYTGVLAGSTYIMDFYVDNFCIVPFVPTGCPMPTGLGVTTIGCDSAQVSWIPSGAAGNSYVEFGATGFTPGSGTVAFGTSPLMIGGLSPGTTYEVYVADTCGADTSALLGPISFTTASGPLPNASFTLSSSHTGNTQVVNVDASASTNGDSYSWDFGNGNNGSGVTATETYNLPNGAYSIKLTVTNACGSDDTTIVINTDIGIDEPDFAKTLSLYPNPSEGVFNLSFDASGAGDISFDILDGKGKLILHKDLNSESGTYEGPIDISHLPKGIYMLRVNSDLGKVNRRLTKM